MTSPERRVHEEINTTCAACDYPLGASAIQVTVGSKTVDACCEECVTKLKEAHAAANATS